MFKIKNLKKNTILIIILLIAFIALIVIYSANVRLIAEKIGTERGKLVGTAYGTSKAFKAGEEGYKEGLEKALSAEDTVVKIKSRMNQISRLQVLVAGIKANDVIKIGEESNPKYAALYVKKGEAVYTVDLEEISIEDNGEQLIITIPSPQVTQYFGETETVAEYQPTEFTGDAKYGAEAYENSQRVIAEKMDTALSEDSALMEQARSSAIEKVTEIAKSVNISGREILVQFEQEANAE